jgi:hypothetical protein
MSLTGAELQILVTSFYLSSTLNLLGSLFTIVTFLIFKEARNTATYLIFALALSDLCSACGSSFIWIYVIKQENNVYCKIQAGMLMFGLIASFLWSLNIGCVLLYFKIFNLCLFLGLYLFLVLYKDVDLEYLRRFKPLFHLFAWGYATVATAIPYFFEYPFG